jgi:hypothetical protein
VTANGDTVIGQFEASAEALAQSIRDLIAALEEAPSLSDAEAHLLANLRVTLAEWEASDRRGRSE